MWSQWIAYRKAELPRFEATEVQKRCNYNFIASERLVSMFDVYPDFHHGSMAGGCGTCKADARKSDDRYIYRNKGKIKDGMVVAVNANDIPDFIREILPLVPEDAKITLVSMHNDMSQPVMQFVGFLAWDNKDGVGRVGWTKAIWQETYDGFDKRVTRMLDFIRDKRIKHWYVQNYDLFGCQFWTNSPITDLAVLSKVSPIPIGTSWYARDPSGSLPFFAGCRSGESGEDDLLRKLGAFKPWSQRLKKILGGDSYAKTHDGKLSRVALNTALNRQPNRYTYKAKAKKGMDSLGVPANVAEFWRRLRKPSSISRRTATARTRIAYGRCSGWARCPSCSPLGSTCSSSTFRSSSSIRSKS